MPSAENTRHFWPTKQAEVAVVKKINNTQRFYFKCEVAV